MHAEMSNEGLEEPMEDLGACGLSFSLADTSDGYYLSMDGYSEHLAALVSHVADGVYTPPTDAKRFERVKQKLVAALEDTTSKMPYEHAMQALSVVSSDSAFSRLDMIAALKATTLPAFQSYLKSISASGLRMQLLATGNVDADTARHLSKTLAAGLGNPKVLRTAEAAKPRALKNSKDIEVRMQNPIPKDSNNAVVNAYQFGIPDVANRVKLLMLGKMISNPAYDELRTKQQLGYVVFAVMMPHLSALQLVMIVQGAKKAPDEINSRVEDVLTNFGQSLRKLEKSKFEGWKDSLRSTINIKDQNMAQEADRLWAQIATDELCFNRKEMALQYLDSFKAPEELAVVFEQMQAQPRKISVRLFGAGVPVGTDLAVKNATSLAEVRQTMVEYNDGQTDKEAVLKGQEFWPDHGVCRVHQ